MDIHIQKIREELDSLQKELDHSRDTCNAYQDKTEQDVIAMRDKLGYRHPIISAFFEERQLGLEKLITNDLKILKRYKICQFNLCMFLNDVNNL
tara:strand:- start:72 stop:353 length:282 start_codon:yes stop_codon:yes gene_type:complete